jgi:excisionase family DNA binding protein
MATLHTIQATMQRIPVARSTLYRMLETGELRSVKVGSRRFIPESAIEEFIAAQELAAKQGSGSGGHAA